MILLPFPAWNLTSCRNENWSKGKQLSRSLPNQSSLLPVTGLTGLLVFECSRCLYSPWPRESRTIKTLPRRSRNSFVYKFLHRIIRACGVSSHAKVLREGSIVLAFVKTTAEAKTLFKRNESYSSLDKVCLFVFLDSFFIYSFYFFVRLWLMVMHLIVK